MYRYVWWMHKRKLFDAYKLPENWMKFIDWQWVKLDDADEVAS